MVVNDKLKVHGTAFFGLMTDSSFQSLQCFGNRLFIRPGFFQRMNLCQTNDLLLLHCFIIISLFGSVRDEYINTYLSFRLETVGSKPSEVVVFIDDVHIIIVRRVERHTHIFRNKISVGIRVVASDKNIIATQSLAIAGVINGDSIR